MWRIQKRKGEGGEILPVFFATDSSPCFSCSDLFFIHFFVSALKYSTAVPVIFLSALKYHVLPDQWTNIYRPLWLLSSVLNSSYSFYWDVNRDWDMRYVDTLFSCWWSANIHITKYLFSILLFCMCNLLKLFILSLGILTTLFPTYNDMHSNIWYWCMHIL